MKTNEQSLFRQQLIILASVTAFLAVILAAGSPYLFVSSTPVIWCFAIIVLLAIYEATAIRLVHKKINGSRPQQVVNLYMALKTIKILLFVGTIMIYALAVKVETKRFVLVAVVVYLIYLLLDTLSLSSIEKRKKRHEKQ